MLKTMKTDFRLFIIFLKHKFSFKGYRHKSSVKGKGMYRERQGGDWIKVGRDKNAIGHTYILS